MIQHDSTSDGLASLPSAHAVPEMVARLKGLLATKGRKLFAKIDHASGAEAAGLARRPTQARIFGDPHLGTPLMQSAQMIGLDRPLRALVEEDEIGKVWPAATEPCALGRRYRIANRAQIATVSSRPTRNDLPHIRTPPLKHWY